MNWPQLQAIVWLRWRLSRNQFVRGGQVNRVLAILSIVVLASGAIGAGVGGVVGGLFAGWKAPAPVLLIIWDAVVFGFLVFWFTGLMVEIQRSESIDLPKLLHLPVTLSQVFVFNYLASHFSPGMVVALPAMLGLCAGLIVGAGPIMVLLVPLVLGFVFMMTAWTYCLRGWLAAMMVNKRRRRTVVVWVTIVFVLLCQLPNAFFNSSLFRQQIKSAGNAGRQQGKRGGASSRGLVLPDSILQAHLVVPPGWIGYGAMTLKESNPWPALGAAAASWLIGVLGLMRAYRMTIRFYQGADGRAERKPAQPQAPGWRRGTLLVERHVPGLPEEAAALTLATFRSLTRAPELKMAFIMPVVMAIVLGATRITNLRHRPSGLEAWSGFVATAVAAASMFSVAPLMSNVFGLDRNGFRALVLLPTRRHYVLLAKNLACAPFAALIAVVLLVAIKFVGRLPWEPVLAGLLQAGCAFLMFCLLGNTLSILAPYRLATGSLQAKKPKPVVFIAMFATILILPLMALPLVAPPGLGLLCSTFNWAPWLPVNLAASLCLLAAIAAIYRLLLPMQGRLLARREQKILQEVTEEVE